MAIKMTTVWIDLKESLLLHNWRPAVLLWKKMVKRSIGSLCTVSQSKQSDICLVCPIVEELCIENANDKYLVYLTWTQRSSPKPSSAPTLVCKYSLNNELYPFKITSEVNKNQEWKVYLCAFEVRLPTHLEQRSDLTIFIWIYVKSLWKFKRRTNKN